MSKRASEITITIPLYEYKFLVRKEATLDAITDLLYKDKYPLETIKTILNIETEEK